MSFSQVPLVYFHLKQFDIHILLGSFATATCMICKYRVDKEAVKDDIMQQVRDY